MVACFLILRLGELNWQLWGRDRLPQIVPVLPLEAGQQDIEHCHNARKVSCP